MESAEGAERGPKRSDARELALAALLGILAYINSLYAPFLYDDRVFAENPALRDLWGFVALAHPPNPSRWVGYVTFALNYRLGGAGVVGFHLVNLCIHLACGALVFALVRVTFRTPRMVGSGLAGASRAIAFAAAALFVTHPLQTESVTYVVQRFTSLATLFYLAAVLLYARWRLAAEADRPPRRSVVSYVVALSMAALAMRTKEIAFTLPFAVTLYELVFFGRPTARRAAWLAPFFAVSALVPLAFVTFDRPVAEMMSDAAAVTYVQTRLSRLEYLATQLTVIPRYLLLLLFPAGQNVDHDPALQHAFLTWPVLAGLGVVLALLAGAVALCRGAREGRMWASVDPAARLVGFGILWFLLTLSVESSVIPIVDVMVEHRLYLPLAGLIPALVTAFGLGVRRAAPARVGRAVAAVGLAVAVYLAVATYLRNEVWRSEVALWADAAAKSPSKPRPHYNLGLALARAHREEEAIPELQRNVQLDPNHANGYEDLGLALAGVGRAAEAEEALRHAATLAPERAEAQLSLGTLYLNAGRPLEALPLLARALELRPGYPQAYANAAAALNQLRRYEDTLRLMTGAPPEAWENAQASFNAGVAYAAVGDGAAAARQADSLERIAPSLAAQLRRFMASSVRR